uniref:50S small subunit ribosomal protein L24e n=1 Tax=Kwoniella dejecticola CBS 10117 TaxID=1296121 RepID=A0A1A5ZXF1_9TREE|nr:50S small subunit ribosomal protein L24e [Kwoniella dejecticola CBS 10117]OBR82479.1 50S small subunit ribosomal protein L24e [Kwoniella dejecticola CBS 10117]
MRVDRCDFSGYKVYPSRGKVYVRGDSKTFRFLNHKSESLFLQRKNPRKIAWTQVYRRMHKKGITEEVAKKRSRKNVKVQDDDGEEDVRWTVVVDDEEGQSPHRVPPAGEGHNADSCYFASSQRGIVGADLASILAKRTAKPEVRAAARAAAITKAKTEKRDKETSKAANKGQSNVPKVSKQAMKGGKGGR